jgi:hypothetical protein
MFLHITFHFQSGSSITTLTFYTKKEWPNIGEEEEWEENNIREFTKLIGQHEQAWKLAREELETIDVGDEEIKRELKIRTLITPKEREELIALLREVPLVEGCKSIKQRLGRTNLNVLIKVKVEIKKQWNAGFFRSNQISTMGVQHSGCTKK